MKTYNTVIIGGGASGLLAGIYLNDENSILLEKNNILGKKLLLTGGGRCNLTNNSSFEEYMNNYYKKGNYYRPAFNNFFNSDIIELLENNGCKTKVEDNNRVFPITDESKSVVNTLINLLENSKTNYKLNANVISIKYGESLFKIELNDSCIQSKNIILATGGFAYPNTGSDGSGYNMAIKLGHTKSKKMSGLCPVKIDEKWINKLQGISLNVKIEVKSDNKSIIKDTGPLMFTHNGLSGYVILDNSMTIEKHLQKNKKVTINIDLASEYSYELLDKKLQEEFIKHPNQGIKKCLHLWLPKKMAVVFLDYLTIDYDKKLNQITKKERIKIRDNMKRLQLTINSANSSDAIVSNSGIKQKEINPDTCESKIIPNLYITGELIEGCGICGGYNLQKAFSTGVLAAQSINRRS